MCNLLVKSGGWTGNRAYLESVGLFEHTDPAVAATFKGSDGSPDLVRLRDLPCLFMPESLVETDGTARVGHLRNLTFRGREVAIDFDYDNHIPPIPLQLIHRQCRQLAITTSQFSLTHWAVKDVDFFREIIAVVGLADLTKTPKLDAELVAVMMPFEASYADVYSAIQQSASDAGFARCTRADEIWKHENVIDDIRHLISTAAVVVCDLSDANPNVFYEMGIAHALQKDTVLITRHPERVPFDVKPIRYLPYVASRAGFKEMRTKLTERLGQIRRGD